MHAKYEVSISNGSKVIAKVKVDNRQTNKQTDKQIDKQTGQKQYAPDHSIWGHKKSKIRLNKKQTCITLCSSLLKKKQQKIIISTKHCFTHRWGSGSKHKKHALFCLHLVFSILTTGYLWTWEDILEFKLYITGLAVILHANSDNQTRLLKKVTLMSVSLKLTSMVTFGKGIL